MAEPSEDKFKDVKSGLYKVYFNDGTMELGVVGRNSGGEAYFMTTRVSGTESPRYDWNNVEKLSGILFT